VAVGCGDEDKDGDGAGGTAGKGGSAGSSGAAGKGGSSAGKGGSAGSAGKGGSAGTTADGGIGGMAGDGSGGEDPVAGQGGATGGSGGEPVAGAGGDDQGVGGDGQGGASAGTGGDVGGAGGEGGAMEPEPFCPVDETVEHQLVPLSTAGHDGLFGVVYDAAGNIYATGYAAAGVAGGDNRATIVAKFDSTGNLVTAFGDAGIATVDVVAAGNGEQPRGIALQSDGKIIVAGQVEHMVGATGLAVADRNVYVLRLDTSGDLDETFGDDGIRTLDFNQGIEGLNNQGAAALVGVDQQWGLNVYADDKVLVFGTGRAAGNKLDGTPRQDTDWKVARLDANGTLDDTFGSAGVFTLDIAQAGASARTCSLLAGDSVVCAGYSTYDDRQRPVLFKLLSGGTLDPSFGGGDGIFSSVVGSAAEAYAAAVQSTGKFVTAGYGRPDPTATSSDFVSIRVTAAGGLDTTFGTNGAFWLDVGGYGDNARAIAMLPDDSAVLIGGGRQTETETDGIVAVLTPDGAADTTFAPNGCRSYDFGTPGDFLWAGAVSPNGQTLALVGLNGVPAGDLTADTDSALILLPITP
jgi:uncharacterized delta-60 repeat protein